MKHILTGAIIGAILGLLIAVATGIGEVTATGVNEVAEASAVIGAIACATLGHSLINYRANRKVKIMAKRNAKAKIEAERRAKAEAERKAKEVERIVKAAAKRRAKAEAEHKTEKAERIVKAEKAERIAKATAKRRAKAEAERKTEKAERRVEAAAKRRAKAEAERKTKEAERIAKATAKRKATIAAKRKAIAKIEASIKAAIKAATMDKRRVESDAVSEDERIASQIEAARTRAIKAASEAINIGKSMNNRVSANVIRDARLAAVKATKTTSKAVPITDIDTKLIARTIIDAIETAIKTETEDAVKAIIETISTDPIIVAIKAAIKAAIQAANEAAIMDARIARSAAASNVERIAAIAIEDVCIALSYAASEYKRSGAVDAARIAAVEDAGTRAIQAASEAASNGRNMSKGVSASVIRSARLAAIKTAISTASDGIGGDARIAKIAAEIENARTQKIENARAIANAGKNARIVTIDTDIVARAIEDARTDATKDIIANANTRYARMVAIEATVAIAIIDIIEAAIETDTAEDGIKNLMEVKIPSAIKEASRAARVYAKPAGLNVPVDNYKDLPRLNAPAGYVYVIQDMSHSQQYKIGRTNHPASRLNRFGVELPITTEVIAILRTDDDKELEQRLHQKFASSRTQGEWFALDAAQIGEIRRM